MKFDPPIKTRETDELIHIANYADKWDKSAVNQAKKELEVRGISKDDQERHVKFWDKQAEEEWQLELESRKQESYDLLELFIMALKWPYTMLSEWYLKKDGYLKMHRQRRLSILTGITFFASVLLWFYVNSDKLNAQWQNEVNNEDIYDWERENYSDEDFAESRTKSINMVINKVTKNVENGVPTYLILDGDTIANSEVEVLKELDPLKIRDIVIEKGFDPEHERIIIKIVQSSD